MGHVHCYDMTYSRTFCEKNEFFPAPTQDFSRVITLAQSKTCDGRADLTPMGFFNPQVALRPPAERMLL